MMKKTAGTALAILLLTAACSGSEEDIDAQEETAGEPAVRPLPLSKRDPEAYKMDPGTAMREAPEAMRTEVQQSIVCYVEKKREAGETAAVNAKTIRTITAHIKAGGSSKDYCTP